MLQVHQNTDYKVFELFLSLSKKENIQWQKYMAYGTMTIV